jgi:hypothetical protein
MGTFRQDRWHEVRQMGKTKFVFVYGTLLFGLLMLLLWPFVGIVVAGVIRKFTMFQPQLPPGFPSASWFATRLPLFMAAGSAWGLWVWRNAEARYYNDRIGGFGSPNDQGFPPTTPPDAPEWEKLNGSEKSNGSGLFDE